MDIPYIMFTPEGKPCDLVRELRPGGLPAPQSCLQATPDSRRGPTCVRIGRDVGDRFVSTSTCAHARVHARDRVYLSLEHAPIASTSSLVDMCLFWMRIDLACMLMNTSHRICKSVLTDMCNEE